jgi:hypothetical protein
MTVLVVPLIAQQEQLVVVPMIIMTALKESIMTDLLV